MPQLPQWIRNLTILAGGLITSAAALPAAAQDVKPDTKPQSGLKKVSDLGLEWEKEQALIKAANKELDVWMAASGGIRLANLVYIQVFPEYFFDVSAYLTRQGGDDEDKRRKAFAALELDINQFTARSINTGNAQAFGFTSVGKFDPKGGLVGKAYIACDKPRVAIVFKTTKEGKVEVTFPGTEKVEGKEVIELRPADLPQLFGAVTVKDAKPGEFQVPFQYGKDKKVGSFLLPAGTTFNIRTAPGVRLNLIGVKGSKGNPFTFNVQDNVDVLLG